MNFLLTPGRQTDLPSSDSKPKAYIYSWSLPGFPKAGAFMLGTRDSLSQVGCCWAQPRGKKDREETMHLSYPKGTLRPRGLYPEYPQRLGLGPTREGRYTRKSRPPSTGNNLQQWAWLSQQTGGSLSPEPDGLGVWRQR